MTFTFEPLSVNLTVESRRLRLEKLLQAAAHDFDLRLEFGNRDGFNDETIVLKADPGEVATAQINRLKGKALHLLGHRLSDSQPWAEAARREDETKPYFSVLWHALEDARVENWVIRLWPGAERAFAANLLPNLGGSLVALMPAVDQLELGLYLEGRGYQGARFSPKIRAVLDELWSEISLAASADSARASFNAMQRIYPALVGMLRPGGRRKAKTAPPQPGEESQETRENGDNPPAATPPPGVPDFQESDEFFSVGVAGRRQQFPEWFRPGSAPWFERGLGEKQIHPSALRTNRQTIVEPEQGDPNLYREMRAEIQHEVGFLSTRLTNLIREEVYLRYGGNYRSGKLNMPRLWKQRLGNYRLFQRRITGGSRAVAFTLLVDESASMKGQGKYKIAAKAALLLGETLDLLGAPLEIIGYTTAEYEARAAMQLGLTPAYQYRTMRCSPLEHRIYKRFSEPYAAARLRLTGIQPRCNNWDEEHLLFAFQRIRERPESKKIIIVISDGQPNGDAEHLIRTVEQVERMGVKVIGIGIGADFVRQIYPNAIVVSDFRQMAEELLQILEREFRPGANGSAWLEARLR